MIDTLTINDFFISPTINIISIACSRIVIGKADKLIQTVISVGFSFSLGSLCNLIAVGIVSINRLSNIACKIKRIFFTLDSLNFLLQKRCIIALSVIVAVLSYIILRTGRTCAREPGLDRRL